MKKKSVTVGNFWTSLGAILIGLGILGLFLTFGTSSNSSSSSAAGIAAFGSIIALSYTLPIYAIIGGILCYCVGYLREILIRLSGEEEEKKEEPEEQQGEVKNGPEV